MKKTQKITRSNYQRLIKNINADLDFESGLTRFTFENKNCFTWSYRFSKTKNGYYRVKYRLGHQKGGTFYGTSLETIFECIIDS